MSQLATIPKLNNRIEDLQNEVSQLRSFVIGQAGRDPEGNYRHEFVKKILKAIDDKPEYEYSGRGSLRQLFKSGK